MKFINLIIVLLVPLQAYSHQNDFRAASFHSASRNSKDTLNATFFSPSGTKQLKSLTRSSDFPTQVIRMEHQITKQQLTCPEVQQQIKDLIIDKVATDLFDHAFFVSCHFNHKTRLAESFKIDSFFDPLNDEAISYLKSYLNDYNGSNLLGFPLRIESAKGVVISLNFAAGAKKNQANSRFIEYRKDRSNFYFKNNYDMKKSLLKDVVEHFYSNDPQDILPFLDKWMFNNAGAFYKSILEEATYTEIEPERIFIMGNGDDLFVSGLKQYFKHYCKKYENHRCLNNG